MCFRFWNLILDSSIFIIVATVPTGLQSCAKKFCKYRLSGGGGTPWLQAKSNFTFKVASLACNQGFGT